MLPSISVTPNSVMVFDTNLRENYPSQSQSMHLQENYLKPRQKDELNPFSAHSCHGNFLQDFQHIEQFHHMHGSSSSNQVFGDQTQNFDLFGNAECANTDFDVYDGKSFAENNSGSEHAHNLIDNFQYDGYSLNIPRRNQLDLMVENHSYFSFNNPSETKSLSYVVPEDEVSSIAPTNYYQRAGLNINNSLLSPTTRRAFKAKKKTIIVKGQWTVEEDRLLSQMVEQYGIRKWSHIALKLPGRIGKQCRERWHNHLRPDIKKDVWTDEEDKILIQAHTEIGNKWAEIAKRLPGRTENAIKNHWNATKRRQYSKRTCRSKYPRGTLLQEYIKSLNLDQNPPRDFRKRSSAKAKKKITCSTSKAATQIPQPHIANQFFPNDRSVPNYEFNDFSLDDNLFEEGCGIDSLLDDMSSVPTMDEKECDKEGMQVVNLDEHQLEKEVEVKKELDLVEMISQANQNIN
ncbi:putative transcription factor MYB-HB-like family [Medicago truncatula]|nr:transcription factor MYB98 [Medicago truncatula]RHN63506.1 putative transcription factor MYB-HB-like family [Medicago truncatula]